MEAVGEQHLGGDGTDAVVGFGDRHHRTQPSRIDRGVVVDERDVPVVAGHADAQVAATGEAEVGERLEDPDGLVPVVGGHPFDDVVE